MSLTPAKEKTPVTLDANGAVVSPEMLREIHKRAQDACGVEDPKAAGWYWLMGHWQMMKYEECAFELQEIPMPFPYSDKELALTMPKRTVLRLPVELSTFSAGLPFGDTQIRLNSKDHQLVGIIINLDATGVPPMPTMTNVS